MNITIGVGGPEGRTGCKARSDIREVRDRARQLEVGQFLECDMIEPYKSVKVAIYRLRKSTGDDYRTQKIGGSFRVYLVGRGAS